MDVLSAKSLNVSNNTMFPLLWILWYHPITKPFYLKEGYNGIISTQGKLRYVLEMKGELTCIRWMPDILNEFIP